MKTLISGRVDAEIKMYIEKLANEKKWTFSFTLNEVLKDFLKKGE